MTFAEMLDQWSRQQRALIEDAVRRQDALLAGAGASLDERYTAAAELRAWLVSKTDLELFAHPQ